jgi:hypothetical protein
VRRNYGSGRNVGNRKKLDGKKGSRKEGERTREQEKAGNSKVLGVPCKKQNGHNWELIIAGANIFLLSIINDYVRTF